ncbi:MAG: alpha/beta fold hydrolase [Trueperaceae bacterium]
MNRNFLAIHRGKLYYEVSGEGHPLILLHAGIANLRMWDEQIEDFSKHYQVICYDARTFGKSTSEAVEFSNRQDLLELLNHLKIDKAHVLGISRGGSIAMDFTLEYPAKVSSLVMVASNPSGFYHDDTEIEKTYFARDEEVLGAKNTEAMADLDVEMWADGPGQRPERANKSVREKVRAMVLEHYQNYFATFPNEEPVSLPLKPPAAQRLISIPVPTLVITGSLDFSYTHAAAELMTRDIPNTKHVSIPDVAHMVNMEKPEEFNKVVLEFLNHLFSALSF